MVKLCEDDYHKGIRDLLFVLADVCDEGKNFALILLKTEKFLKRAKEGDGDGVLVVDVPFQFVPRGEFYAAGV